MNTVALGGRQPGNAASIVRRNATPVGSVLNLLFGREQEAVIQSDTAINADTTIAFAAPSSLQQFSLIVQMNGSYTLTLPADCVLPNYVSETSTNLYTPVEAGTYTLFFVRYKTGWLVEPMMSQPLL